MKLRKMTSAGMMDCKKALMEAEGDFNKAMDIIREKGKLVAAKRADRETSEGAVKARIAGGKGILVCLGCETDFVSRNEAFQALAEAIADVAIANCPADLEALKACKMADGLTVAEAVEEQTGKTGEKHVVGTHWDLEDDAQTVSRPKTPTPPGTSARTGDDSSMAVWAIALTAAFAGLAGAVIYRRKRFGR